MPLWIAVILGIVQGLTEFLPVSSSGHLALMQRLFNIEQYTENALAFDVVLHLGTLAAVIFAFRRDIKDLISGAFKVIFRKNEKTPPEGRLFIMLIIATLPMIAGAALDNIISSALSSTVFIGAALCVTAFLLFMADRAKEGTYTEKDAPYLTALKVGLIQLIALFPGISRSGSTLCGGVFCGFKRSFAVKFAFLLSIPAVLGAAVLELPELLHSGAEPGMLLSCAAGFIASAVSGYAAIKTVLLLARKRSLKYFGIYCVCTGLAVIVLSLI